MPLCSCKRQWIGWKLQPVQGKWYRHEHLRLIPLLIVKISENSILHEKTTSSPLVGLGSSLCLLSARRKIHLLEGVLGLLQISQNCTIPSDNNKPNFSTECWTLLNEGKGFQSMSLLPVLKGWVGGLRGSSSFLWAQKLYCLQARSITACFWKLWCRICALWDNTRTRKPQNGLYCIAAGDQPARRACEVHAVYDKDEAWQLYKNIIFSPKKTA